MKTLLMLSIAAFVSAAPFHIAMAANDTGSCDKEFTTADKNANGVMDTDEMGDYEAKFTKSGGKMADGAKMDKDWFMTECNKGTFK